MLHPAANSHLTPHINGFIWPFLQPTGTPGPHINAFLWASKSAVCQPALKPSKPLKPIMANLAANRHPRASMASSGHPSLPFASSLAANRHPRKPLKTVKLLLLKKLSKRLKTATPKPHINGFFWASKSAVCQLSCSQQAPQETLKNCKTLIIRTLTWHASPATHQWLLMATLAANRHPRATHQWLLMGIQVCRLPALLQPTGTPGPHLNGFLWASKSAVCPP